MDDVTYGAFIVDDEPDIRLLMRILIESHDAGLYVSGEATSGSDALRQLATADPAVVVLDQMMPGLTGVETAARIRGLRPSQPMVLCSAYLDERLESAARDAGVALCLPKTKVGDLARAVYRLATGGRASGQ